LYPFTACRGGCNTKKLHKLIWVFFLRAALKGRYIPAWGNAPGKDYIFPKSPERAIHKKINICHALSGLIGYRIFKSQGVALGWYV